MTLLAAAPVARPSINNRITKLGPSIFAFSIIAAETCPGRSQLCFDRCYARQGNFSFPDVIRNHRNNWEFTQTQHFVPWMNSQLVINRVTTMRVHVAGDFYDAAYVRKWIRIARANPGTVFFAYTRSWRTPTILPALRVLAALPNMRLWFSADQETGRPPRVKRVRTAYMALNDADVPKWRNDLTFRVNRSTVKKWDSAGTLVCIEEQGIHRKQKVTCSRCQLCFKSQPIPRKKSDG